jgi:energy-coupling factor transport system permease protein
VRYVPHSSPLHAARPGVAAAFCLSLGACAFILVHPVVVGALALIVLGCGAACGVGRELLRVARWTIPLTLLIVVVNAVVVRDGLTVVWRFGDVPVLGQIDITLEALVYGLAFGLRLLVVALAFALLTAAVDPDALLRGMRRLSMRSALAATLSTRLVPVLARDARRMADAQRCRAGGAPPSRIALMRAVTSGALDRGLDLAATLDLRGYAHARRPPRAHVPWSRHDVAFCASTVALLALSIAAVAGGVTRFGAYPQLHAAPTGGALALSAALALCALAPFADRRGIG